MATSIVPSAQSSPMARSAGKTTLLVAASKRSAAKASSRSRSIAATSMRGWRRGSPRRGPSAWTAAAGSPAAFGARLARAPTPPGRAAARGPDPPPGSASPPPPRPAGASRRGARSPRRRTGDSRSRSVRADDGVAPLPGADRRDGEPGADGRLLDRVHGLFTLARGKRLTMVSRHANVCPNTRQRVYTRTEPE